jgi:hypothetical protein
MTRSEELRVKLAQVRFVSTAIEPIAAFYAARPTTAEFRR